MKELFDIIRIIIYLIITSMTISFSVLYYHYKTISDLSHEDSIIHNIKFAISSVTKEIKVVDDKNVIKKQTINKDELLKEMDNRRKLNKNFKYISYFLAILISVLGTILLFLGIIISFHNSTQLGWVTVSSGVIVELISVVYFWLVSKTTKEVKKDTEQLMREMDFLLANELIDKIQDGKIRDETYAKIIELLITKK